MTSIQIPAAEPDFVLRVFENAATNRWEYRITEHYMAINKNLSVNMGLSIVYVLSLIVAIPVNAFAPCFQGNTDFRRIKKIGYDKSTVKRYVTPDVVSSLIVATIDADIANIPTNEFAPIFAGGILVMFGGLLSALAVGFIIDKRDLYANIVADSYAQGADDVEFWKGLNEEEKKKTQELLQRLKESKEGGPNEKSESSEPNEKSESSEPIVPLTVTNSMSSSSKAKDSNTIQETKEIGMFSDYGDD